MPSLEETFESACRDKVIPGAILVAADKSGIIYSKAFGSRGPNEPLQVDDIVWIASCTKIITTVSILQCVERDQITLEDDVTLLLPDLGNLPVLTGFDGEGKPILQKRTKPITLRNMLTHTSGLAYDLVDPNIQRYFSSINKPIDFSGLTVNYASPLIFEPTKGWVYGTSLDWCGRLVEHLTGQSLEDYMRKFIWSPLGISDITFWPGAHPELQSRIMKTSVRQQDGQLVYSSAEQPLPKSGSPCYGGQGAYASLPAFVKILHSLLSDDEKLLKNETAAQLFKPQLNDEQLRSMKVLQAMPLGIFGFRDDVELDCGLGGTLHVHGNEKIGRGKNTLTWGGMPNLHWFIDREAGLCGAFGTQLLPLGDPKTVELTREFEKAMYQAVTTSK